MKKIFFLTIIPAFFLTAQVPPAEKLIVTLSAEWGSNEGTLFLLTKSVDGWVMSGPPASVHFGAAGMAWGKGLHPPVSGGAMKKEGDKRSPAGIFSLGSLYGIDSLPPTGVRYPYRQMTEKTRCIDDVSSLLYNRIVEEDDVDLDWKSAENMRSVQPDYKYVLVVHHNGAQENGEGSCIFFHINNVPTTGCTSMDETTMVSLLQWLDPSKKTAVVQLPKQEYLRYQSEWGLPQLPDIIP